MAAINHAIIYLLVHIILCNSLISDENSIPGEYILIFPDGISRHIFMDTLDQASIKREYSINSYAGVLVKGISSDDMIRYQELGVHMVPNRVVYAFHDEEAVLNDVPQGQCFKQESGSISWGLTRISHRNMPSFNPTDAYYSNETGKCVDIYVVDSGVNIQHESFKGRARYGFTPQELFEEEGDEDLAGHGTHVAGLAAGSLYGTAKHSNVISVKVLDRNGGGTLDWILQGLQWISDNQGHKTMSVINLSLGLKDVSGSLDFLEDILSNISAVSVVAAGNEDDDACNYVPARFQSVITIGATKQDDRLPSYTNYGTCVDLLAPGDKVSSASHIDNSGSRTESGTSMSTGYVSGLVARILEKYDVQPESAEVYELLKQAATVGKTNGPSFNTPDLLVYASCVDVNGTLTIPEWSTEECFFSPSTTSGLGWPAIVGITIALVASVCTVLGAGYWIIMKGSSKVSTGKSVNPKASNSEFPTKSADIMNYSDINV